jgi:hypothetical protein
MILMSWEIRSRHIAQIGYVSGFLHILPLQCTHIPSVKLILNFDGHYLKNGLLYQKKCLSLEMFTTLFV